MRKFLIFFGATSSKTIVIVIMLQSCSFFLSGGLINMAPDSDILDIVPRHRIKVEGLMLISILLWISKDGGHSHVYQTPICYYSTGH